MILITKLNAIWCGLMLINLFLPNRTGQCCWASDPWGVLWHRNWSLCQMETSHWKSPAIARLLKTYSACLISVLDSLVHYSLFLHHFSQLQIETPWVVMIFCFIFIFLRFIYYFWVVDLNLTWGKPLFISILWQLLSLWIRSQNERLTKLECKCIHICCYGNCGIHGY